MDNSLTLEFLISKKEIDDLVIPYIDLITESGYKVNIKKTLVPNYYLFNNKLIILNDNENIFYTFNDMPNTFLCFTNNILYVNTSGEGFGE